MIKASQDFLIRTFPVSDPFCQFVFRKIRQKIDLCLYLLLFLQSPDRLLTELEYSDA